METWVTWTRIEPGVLLTLNRPERMNAMSTEMLEQLDERLDAILKEPDIRVVIVTGAGEKAFCAGADLKERLEMTLEETRRYLRRIRATFVKLERLPMPTIAMVNGVALGGGCELALSCDIRVMSATAKMGLTETRLAIIPGAGGTQRLARLVGKGKAKELIFTGRKVGAEEALAMGMCERVAGAAELRATCLALAEEICLAGSLALVQAKFAIDRGLEVDLMTGLDIESKAYEVLLPTADRLEALAAFREKRRPSFQSR